MRPARQFLILVFETSSLSFKLQNKMTETKGGEDQRKFLQIESAYRGGVSGVREGSMPKNCQSG